ncbi:MAG: hypothetical protein U0263_26060 [Polyangiaceae bacterium]
MRWWLVPILITSACSLDWTLDESSGGAAGKSGGGGAGAGGAGAGGAGAGGAGATTSGGAGGVPGGGGTGGVPEFWQCDGDGDACDASKCCVPGLACAAGASAKERYCVNQACVANVGSAGAASLRCSTQPCPKTICETFGQQCCPDDAGGNVCGSCA